MNRNDIKGFTIGNSGKFNIEIVLIKYIPKTFALWNGTKLLKRIEF